MQETWVQSLSWEDPVSWGATKLVCHNHWSCALEPVSRSYWAHGLQLLRPTHLEPVLCNEESPQWAAYAPQLERSHCLLPLQKSPRSNNDPAQPQIKKYKPLKSQLIKDIFTCHVAYSNHGGHLSWSCPHSRGGDYEGEYTRGVNLGAHLRILPTTWAYSQFWGAQLLFTFPSAYKKGVPMISYLGIKTYFWN